MYLTKLLEWASRTKEQFSGSPSLQSPCSAFSSWCRSPTLFSLRSGESWIIAQNGGSEVSLVLQWLRDKSIRLLPWTLLTPLTLLCGTNCYKIHRLAQEKAAFKNNQLHEWQLRWSFQVRYWLYKAWSVVIKGKRAAGKDVFARSPPLTRPKTLTRIRSKWSETMSRWLKSLWIT